jgi:O-glycosyl hydrolase
MKKKKIIAFLSVLTLTTLITTCELEVIEPVQEVSLTDPYISKQPASYSYFVGEDPEENFPLSIEVYEWASSDGNLTYQWYTFDETDDYILNKVTPIPGASGTLTPDPETGLSAATYTPSAAADGFSVTAGSKNYYYVEVTNNNPSVNTGANSGTIKSQVSIISFTNGGDALPPVISRHPGSAGYQAGRAVNSLNVRSSVRLDQWNATDLVYEARGVLSYQWYTLTIGEDADGEPVITGREEIANAQGPSYQPDQNALKAGENYFYVEVTSTEGAGASRKTATTVSVPATIEILRGIRAVAPVITVQPKDRMYFTGETVGELSVAGETRDNGQITYQWYSIPSATIPSNGGTAVANATGPEFTPAINNSAAGTFYYYAAVTNRQTYVTSNQVTARTNSKVAKVSVAAPGTGTETFNATVTVANPKTPAAPGSNRYQYVRGYGGMDVAWANFPEQKPEDMELMYDPDRLGYNINRIMISPGKVNPSDGIADLVNGHRPSYYENVKIVNKYGGYNLASPWSPPKEWKSNNSINGGGVLMKQYYQQFANYLKAFAQDLYDHGAPIYAISISNEPNYTAGYDGCEWTGDEMRDFYKQVGRFTNGVRGYGGGKTTPVVLTVNGESANTPQINISALRDPVSRAAIDLYCRHVYGEQTRSLWRYDPAGGYTITGNTTSAIENILDRGNGTKFEVWMTEHNINSANATAYPSDSTWNYVWRYMNDVDLVMRLNNENAFVWWASKRFYSMIGDGQYGTTDGVALPRGWGLSHYAKYTIDTHRIVATVSGTTGDSRPITFESGTALVNKRDFSLDNDSARITAYASITSGKDNAPIEEEADDVEFISLVMMTPTATNGLGGHNMGTLKIDMPSGFLIGSYTAIRSTSLTSVHQSADVTVSQNRQSAYVTLGRGQMLSVKFIRQ